ncbi:hypothetical protein F7725_001477, partial [Dissostichus mawsoni]
MHLCPPSSPTPTLICCPPAPTEPPPPSSVAPRPPQSPPDAHLEDATRSLHKALALEGLRDWYLRNTLGPPSNQVKVNGGVKGQGGGGAGSSSSRPIRRRRCRTQQPSVDRRCTPGVLTPPSSGPRPLSKRGRLLDSGLTPQPIRTQRGGDKQDNQYQS